jgi:3D (Asp-Asp-Asp) domain-containing protein
MALWAAGYRWQWADTVIPPAITPLTTSTTITLVRAQPIQIQVDGQAIRTVTQRATVSEALAEAGVALLGDDYAVPAADAPVPTDGLLRVVRVREERIAALTPIPFETVYQALDTVEIDTVSTIQLGAYGVRRALTRVRYEDGVELSRAVEAEVVAQPPTPQIIGYGTKIVVRTLDTPDGAIEYWRAYTMYATSYAARFFKVYSNRTASGMLLTKGVVAIDRTMMPFGTKMYVPGYGFAVAGDTGGGVQGRFIDLGYDDWNYVGWHSVTMVYFLTPIPPADQIRWIIPSTVP